MNFRGSRPMDRRRLVPLVAALVLPFLMIACFLVPSKAPSMPYLSSFSIPALKFQESPNKLLVLYAFHESADGNARANAEYFIRRGLHDAADFIFIFNGETDLGSMIPQNATNIRVVQRDNTCYDMGAYAEVLSGDDYALVKKYEKFIMLNASIRGPFLPMWSDACWSDVYSDRVTDEIKLVGMTFNCRPTHHIQSMILTTDRSTMEKILAEPQFNQCFAGWVEAVGSETAMSPFVEGLGYKVDVLMTAFHTDPDYTKTCSHDDVLFQDRYYGITVHPYETIFIKANRDVSPLTIQRLTEWHDQMGYSSQRVCGKDRNRKKLKLKGY